MATVDYKACTLCKQTLPASSFGQTPRIKSGLQPGCKACLAAQRREKRNVDIEAFRAWQREYYRDNADHMRQHARACYHADPAKFNARSKSYYEKDRQRGIDWAFASRKRRPEHYRELARCQSIARRALIKGGATSLETRAWKRAQKKVCHWCAKRCAKDFHIDHIMPLARGGRHELHNLCIACPDCNHRKHARDPIEWAQMIGKLL